MIHSMNSYKFQAAAAAVTLSGLTSACMHRAESQKMLEVRAGYAKSQGSEAAALSLPLSQDNQNSVRVVPAKTVDIWIFPHETSPTEYFQGGWVTTLLEGDRWQASEASDDLKPKAAVTPLGAGPMPSKPNAKHKEAK